MRLSLAQIIEGLLFYFGDTISITTLATYTKKSEEEVREALTILKEELVERGVVLVVQNEKVALATHPDISTILTSIQKEELEGELSKAAQEVLSIVLYAGPISKGYIDYIRGVNSTVSVRNLVARGLIEKKEGGSRSQYVVTTDFLMSLGVNTPESIEGYQDIRNKLEAILQVSKKD
jgi:segregation and condensation protein B